jgi:hypothetical protein
MASRFWPVGSFRLDRKFPYDRDQQDDRWKSLTKNGNRARTGRHRAEPLNAGTPGRRDPPEPWSYPPVVALSTRPPSPDRPDRVTGPTGVTGVTGVTGGQGGPVVQSW